MNRFSDAVGAVVVDAATGASCALGAYGDRIGGRLIEHGRSGAHPQQTDRNPARATPTATTVAAVSARTPLAAIGILNPRRTTALARLTRVTGATASGITAA
jgi:hypothetical protein